MAKFIRHIGRHGERKVAVIFHQVPDEAHMCYVVYTQLINQHLHDPLMRVLESESAQHPDCADLAVALDKESANEMGKSIFRILIDERILKKVPTNQVIMTPAPGISIKLSELNEYLAAQKLGGEAAAKMKALDESAGLQNPADVRRRQQELDSQPVPSNVAAPLSDEQIAKMQLEQAERMEREATALLAEATRIRNEFSVIAPEPPVVETPKPKRARKGQ